MTTNDDKYDILVKSNAIAALLLEAQKKSFAKKIISNISEDDIRIAQSVGTNTLRIHSIECGLKFILQEKDLLSARLRNSHDLKELWEKIPQQEKTAISSKIEFSESDIENVLSGYSRGTIAARYLDSDFGSVKLDDNGIPDKNHMKECAKILQKLSICLGNKGYTPSLVGVS